MKKIGDMDTIELAAYYHWNDRQSLEVALMVCEKKEINIAEVQRWSVNEGMEEKFNFFKEKYDLIKQEIENKIKKR